MPMFTARRACLRFSIRQWRKFLLFHRECFAIGKSSSSKQFSSVLPRVTEHGREKSSDEEREREREVLRDRSSDNPCIRGKQENTAILSQITSLGSSRKRPSRTVASRTDIPFRSWSENIWPFMRGTFFPNTCLMLVGSIFPKRRTHYLVL